jgi:NADH-quinone oxidoreductase subunit G
MPKLIIDNIEVEVAEGTTVLEAAQSVDIPIPHFCWHPALGKAGACRVCAVKLLDGPVKGIQMSCMLPVQEGMVVSTTDPEAMELRRNVIEWLMINHPHDCPVCDEGGECQLQDFTIAGGHGIRRYHGSKRTHVNQELGPYIQHEMNRCIQCYRCVRFYQEFAGGADFGVMGSAGRVYYGRFQDGPLESPFSGNLVDICPTGVFTDKTARFRARYWDYDMAPSICTGCSLGCNTTPVGRYRELLKIVARRNDSVNGWFICDKERFGNRQVNAPDRPRSPLVEGRQVGWNEALETLLLRLGEIEDLYGSESVALVGSSRMSLEAGIMLSQLATVTGTRALCYFVDGEEFAKTLAALAVLEKLPAASMADVGQADCVVILEADLREEGPMLLLAVRQAWKRGAPVILVGKAAPLEQTMAVGVEAITLGFIEEVPLGIFANPVIICGTKNSAVRDIETLVRAEAKVAFLFSGPNSFGAALLSREHGGTSFKEAIATGKIKGVIAVEADIPPALLARIPFVASLDWRATDPVSASQVVLPTTASIEMAGTFINFEGRAQRFKPVLNPGLPPSGMDPAEHPPREHSLQVPGGDVRPAWRVLADLVALMGGDWINEPLRGRWSALADLEAESEGVKVLLP